MSIERDRNIDCPTIHERQLDLSEGIVRLARFIGASAMTAVLPDRIHQNPVPPSQPNLRILC
jgi:hypothetical protein